MNFAKFLRTPFLQIQFLLYFKQKMLKVNESRYIALFLVRESIKKFFSIDCVKIDLFLIFFSIYFALPKRLGLPHIAYIVIHEL